MRSLTLLVVVGLVAGACSSDTAPPAPAPGPVQTVCLPEFCIDYPAEWVIEVGEDFVTLNHPAGAEASAGRIDMQGVVEGAGGAWPADGEETMRRFWELLDDLGTADLEELRLTDGAVDTEGRLDDGRLWHRLLPTMPPRAIGAELRGPDRTWEAHAEIITGSLRAPNS
ncbi:MAG: hypothetical protein OES13_09895 [Acidimicrobiia bacterium]|nr:hypothetical protein [Acidimicrobiia bacterium]